MELAPQTEQSDVMACNACGATHAPKPIKKEFGLCANCATDFQAANGGKKCKSSDLNRLLANRLKKTINRYSEGKIVGRCEAITHSVSGGHQCAQHAQTVVRGWRVCTQHARSKAPNFVWGQHMTSAMVVICMVRSLAEKDKKFKAALKEIVS